MELFNLLAKLTLDTNDFDKDLDQAERDLEAMDVSDPKLGLDNDEFNDNIEESQGLGDTFGTEMTNVFNKIKTALTVTGIVGAIAGIVNGLKEAINMTAETADGIDKGSKKLGISRQAYQEWDHALRQSGASIQDVKKGIINFQAAIKAADPATPFADAEDQVDGLADKTAGLSQDAYEALRDLGLLSRLQAGEFKDAAQLMNESLLALAGYEGSTDDRGILVRKLFGKGGDELNAMLDEGVDGVKALLSEASDLGLIMSDDEINNAVAYGDAVANLNAELDAIKQAFVADIIPAITDATKWLTEFLTKLNPRLQTNSIFAMFEEINTKTVLASTKIDEATVTAKKLIEDLQSMGDYWSLDEEGRMTWDALAEKALELFPQLSQYIDKDGKKIDGNTAAIERNIDAWARMEKQRILASAMQEKEEAVAVQLTKAYEKGAEARAKEAEAEGKRQTAMKKLNDELKAAGMGQLSENATEKQMSTSVTNLMDYYGDDDAAQARIGLILKEWGETKTEAGKLRAEAEKLKDEANNAQAALADQQRYLMEEMGFTQQEIANTEGKVDEYIKKLNGIPRNVVTRLDVEEADWHPHAIGGTIPYDNYPALLHRGERVLTATEVRRGDGGGADYSAMEDRIVAAINKGMQNATVRTYLNGKDITDDVNRRNMEGIKGRRFAT